MPTVLTFPYNNTTKSIPGFSVTQNAHSVRNIILFLSRLLYFVSQKCLLCTTPVDIFQGTGVWWQTVVVSIRQATLLDTLKLLLVPQAEGAGASHNTCLHINSLSFDDAIVLLFHWGRVTHICVGNLTIIGSDNGLSTGRPKPLSEPILEYCQFDA